MNNFVIKLSIFLVSITLNFFSFPVFSANNTTISELDCWSDTLDNGAKYDVCAIKPIDFNAISFEENEQDVLRCWSLRPLSFGESFAALDFSFKLDIDNKEIALDQMTVQPLHGEAVTENGRNLGYMFHLFDNMHRVENVLDSGMKIQLKFNYPDIVSIPDEAMKAKLTFYSGESLDLELNCIASPFLMAKFPVPQIETTSFPLMADNLKLGEINMDDINYHALIIGINDYDPSLGKLNTAINDAKGLDDILQDKYGFKTTTLINATRDQIIDALDNYVETLTFKDSLLIYFAGHGQFDAEYDENGECINDTGDCKTSYWLPIDATIKSKSNWISNAELIPRISSLKSTHVLVIADTCYAGGWSRGVQNHSETRDVKKYFQRLIDKQSRKIMASGGIEQVMDGGGGKHSVFAKELLSALKENTSYLETYSLFDTVRKKVIPNSPQTPEYEIIFMGGDDGGEFVFVPGSLVN